MNPERWQDVKKVLAAALDQPPHKRRAYLDEVCTDPLLRCEVDSLIAAHEQGDSSFMEQPAIESGALKTGARLGAYEILAALGRGGMGEVYEARDTKLERNVAIKVLPVTLIHDPQRLARFQREARMLASLNHPNIATIYGLEQYESVHYLIMELVRGETLAKRLRAGALPVHEVLDLSIECADALDAAHAQGIIHRDIKPANIIVTDRGRVKMLDFGLAKITLSEVATSSRKFTALTVPGVAVGTVAYMSPEQLRGEELDTRTDLFSFGVVLYEMATGRLPFSGNTSAVIFNAILNQAPIPVLRLNPSLPARLEEIVSKALEKDCTVRYQSASEMRTDLRRLERDAESGRAAVTSVVPVVSRTSWRTRAALGIAAVVLLALTGIGIAYRVASRGGETADSVAVLPFVNVTKDPDVEYLSDGIPESLIDNLSQLHSLRIMSPGTVSVYKTRQADPRQIGRELKVAAVLQGRLTKLGDRLLVQADLVKTSDASELWGAHYERKMVDVISIQDDISREIVRSLRPQMSEAEKKRIVTQYTRDPGAYQLYLKGLYHSKKFTKPELSEGLNYFRQAIALDPSYALAYTGIAYNYGIAEDWLFPPREVMPEAEQAAHKAVALDGELGEAHSWVGYADFWYEYKPAEAEKELQLAIDLDPNNAEARGVYGLFLVSMKRFDEGIAQSQQGQELDPLSVEANLIVGLDFYFARRYDDARTQLLTSLEMDPNSWPVRAYLGWVYEQKGEFTQAIAEFQKARQIEPDIAEPLACLGRAYALAGRASEARAVLRQLDEYSKTHWVTAYYRAFIYTALGDKGQAFAALEKAYQDRSWYVTELLVDPKLDPLRSDPRFADLLRRMNLQQ